ncbi:MAG TPA: glycosyl transferase group 1 [Planctomycetales bacterium]|jgi:glycosyltransferase involved in cell wall biosynthesis|nr:glycosyl transferase group 1 [Planctomycetales bacterium]
MQTLTETKTLELATSAAAEAAPDPVRVCFLIDDLAAAGTESQLLALIDRLDRGRVQPYLCLLRGQGSGSRALEPENCPVWRMGVGSLCRPATLVQAMRFIRFLRRERIDVVQAYFPDSAYFGLPAAWLAGVPHRLRTRNNLGHWLTPLHRRLGRLLNRIGTGTVVNCAAARNALLAAEGAHANTVTILENGVDHGRFLAVPPLSVRTGVGGRTIGAAANLRPVKGLDLLLDAAALLSSDHPDLVCQIAGEGEMHGALEESARRHGLADRLHLLGSVADVPTFLSGLDIAVLPSRSEGMSNALLEYMAAGRPVVATAVGAAAELIDDGVHGLLVPPNDARKLAEAIDRLLKNPGLAKHMGDAARRRVRERYSREAMVERFTDFYERLSA